MDMRGCDMLFMLVEVIVDMCGFVFFTLEVFASLIVVLTRI